MITKRIREMVEENAEILQILKNEKGNECIVVDMFSYLTLLTPVSGIALLREGADFYLEDKFEQTSERISLFKEFSKQKATALRFLKEVF